LYSSSRPRGGAEKRATPARIEPLEERALLSAPVGWDSRGPGGGGAFFAPSFSPYNNSELYATSDMSGVYHTTNLGASWSLIDFHQIQGNRPSRVQFTNDPNVLYCLDETELAGGSDVTRPSRSNDGGQTWHPLTSWDQNNTAFGFWADPANLDHLLITDYTTLYFSGDGGTTFNAKFATTNTGAGLYVAGTFFDGNNIYVCTNAGMLVSTNGGSTFNVVALSGVPSGGNYLSFAGAKQNGATRFFCITAGDGDIFAGLDIEGVPNSSISGVFSIDWGTSTSWTSRTTGIPTSEYPRFVSLATNNINTAYLAGSSDSQSPVVLQTTSAGASWADVLHTANNQNVFTGWQGAGGDRGWSFGELALDFQVAPNNPSDLAWTDFGMIHISSDGGATWHQAYLNAADQNAMNTLITPHKAYHGIGLEDTSAHWITWADASTMVAGYTDIYCVRSTDGGGSWAFPTNISLSQNTTYHIAKLTTNTVPSGEILYAATSNTHDIYQSTHITDASIDSGLGRIIYSTDKGNSWSILHDFGHPVIWNEIDPANPNRMYASVVNSSVGGIYVTNDLNDGTSATWTKLPNPPRTQGHPFDIQILADGTLVVSYSARRTTNFTASSGVFVSIDGGQTWADRSDAGMQYWTKDITIDPTDASQNTWYAAVRSGYGGPANDLGGLYRTTNRGVSWTRVFATDSCESATVNAATGEMCIATLDSGVYYTANPRAATPAFAQTNYPFRQPERIFIDPFDSSQVWVAAFGYGMAVGTNALVINGPYDFGTNTGSGILAQNLPPVIIHNGGHATVGSSANHANRTVLVMPSLTFDGSTNGWQGLLDLNDNDLIVQNGSLADITNQLKQGLNAAASGYWNGAGGIISTTAAGNAAHTTGLGVLLNNDGSGHKIYGSGAPRGLFDGQDPPLNAVLVKYTYYGDTDFNGRVEGGDYAMVDNGFNTLASGWINGDFNYNGVVDGADYALIDSAFNSQGATPLSVIAPTRAPMLAAPPTSKKSPPAVFYNVITATNDPPPAAELLVASVVDFVFGKDRAAVA
jgi:hypothetical protein